MKKGNKIFRTMSALLAASICGFSLAACGNTPEPPPEPDSDHIESVDPNCTKAGYKEYWIVGEKLYSDSAFTVEIPDLSAWKAADGAGYIAPLGHDFTSEKSVYDNTDADKHWKKCGRSGCQATSDKEDHTYENDECVCGRTLTGHINALSPTCTVAGHKEYWKVGAKYYSDGEYTTEITDLAAWKAVDGDGYVAPLGHDFTSTASVYVKTDANKHWRVCGRANCDEISEKVDHTYTSGVCVCGKYEADHTPEVPATCTQSGCSEYWEYQGKYYSDSARTTEITDLAAWKAVGGGGYLASLGGHDFVYNHDETNHWMECSRGDGEIQSGSTAAHNFNRNDHHGECECGLKNGFEGYTYFSFNEGGVNLNTTRTDTVNSVKINVANPDGEAWHVKLENNLSDIKVGHYYEITYTLKSTVAGNVKFKADNGVYGNDLVALSSGDVGEFKDVKFRFAVGALNNDKAHVALQLGALSNSVGFEVEVKSVSVDEINDWNRADYRIDNGNSATTTTSDPILNADGSFTVIATGDADGWTSKIAQDITIEAGKTYEMVYVFKREGGLKDKNLKFVVYDGVVTPIDELHYIPNEAPNVQIHVAKFKFTANQSVTKGSCLEYGEITNGNQVTLTFYYIGLREV